MGRKNNKRRLFAKYYFENGFDAIDAHIKAGYNPKYAHTNAYTKLNFPEVQEELKILKEKLRERIMISKEQILADLLLIKDNNMEDAPQHALKSLEMVIKMLGYNEPDKLDVNQDISININLPNEDGE